MTMPLKNGPTHIFFFIETISHLLIYHKSATLDDVVVRSSKKRSVSAVHHAGSGWEGVRLQLQLYNTVRISRARRFLLFTLCANQSHFHQH